ncbi:MAG: DUF2062 domain-containing protein [Candidatus Omnitrophica bacterium]|nr:DUF2062 domain-containing protein [Candidatus Omnitrophota bacterium]MDD5512403.1 DUF2062 domain-containing protein [Candidatus Omnitrophota bacterium]
MKKPERKLSPRRLFRLIYLKLFRIHDSPQRISLGLGVGVFLGIIPGSGPIASLVVAAFLRLNRASALLGSLLTNTWLSVVTFALSVKVGSQLTGTNLQALKDNWTVFTANFHWHKLLELAALKIVFPVFIGYLAVSFCIGSAVYLAALGVLSWRGKLRRTRDERRKTRDENNAKQ